MDTHPHTLDALQRRVTALEAALGASRGLVDQERELTIRLLGIISSRSELHTLLHEVTDLLQQWSGCEAVGIRLRSGHDYPYFEARGFPPEFVEAENSLCTAEAGGSGTPHVVLDCMCGVILSGRSDPSLPFFTSHGSFWTNCTTELLANTSEADRQGRTRNRCHGEGYESVALLPLRSGEMVFGLLQMNDQRRGQFTPEKIAMLERLADSLAVALAHRQAQEELRASEQRYRAIVEHQHELVIHFRSLDEPTFVNPAFCDFFGTTLEQILREGCRPLIHAEDWAKTQEYLRGLLTGRAEGSIEQRVIRHDGAIRWIAWFSQAFRDAHGNVVAFQCVGRDITERRQVEVALRNSEKFVAEILACAGEGIVVYDRQLCYRLWNPFMERLTGLTADEVLGRCSLDLFPHMRNYGIDQLFQRVLQGETVQTPAIPFSVPQSGKTGWIVGRYTPRIGEEGQITGIVGVIHDVTERKRSEEKLQRMQAQLAHSGRLATMGELLAGIAHEINQPLYSIVNYANACGNLLAQEQPDLDLLQQWTTEMRIAAERAGEIIRRLREFARGRSTGHTTVHVPELLEESIELVAFETRTRGVLVECIFPTEIPAVHVDRVQIQQVLVNLLRNASEAVEALPSGDRRITVAAQSREDHVQISISDNGPGIPPESEPWIFDPFYTTKKDGLGLGLAISKTIMQAHGEELQVAATLGGGATFHFLLPAEGGRRCATN